MEMLRVRTVPWIERQLRQTPHFGAIHNVAYASRLDYTLLINQVLLDFKKEFAGYGLGANEPALPSGEKITKLALLQVWSVLSNIGHLFGTFATERGLLYELYRRPELFERFVAALHPDLRKEGAFVLNERRLNDFFYALTAWRISRSPMPDALRGDCIEIWRQFLEERRTATVPSLNMWAFRSARRLAYNRMHVYLGVGAPVDAISFNDVRALSPWVELSYEPLLVKESSLLEPLLHAGDSYQWDHYFSGSEVASDVLAHVRAFRRWWKTAGDNFETAIDSLFGEKPTDWPPTVGPRLKHYARLKLPRKTSEWLDEISEWLKVDAAWTTGNFLVAPRASSGLLVDVYVQLGQPVSPAVLRAAADRLAVHCSESWEGPIDEGKRELWRSGAVFGLRSLALLARDGVRPLLRPAALRHSDEHGDGHVGYAVLADPSLGIKHARELAKLVADDTRRRELEVTLDVAEETTASHEACPLLVFLGATLLVDAKQTQRERAEFDGAWCFFGEEQVDWYFLEHKRSANPQSDLREKLELFVRASEPYKITSPVEGRAAVAKVVFATPDAAKSTPLA
jgi:hypothetical protein